MEFKLNVPNKIVKTLQTIVFFLFVLLTFQIAEAKIHHHTFKVLIVQNFILTILREREMDKKSDYAIDFILYR